MRERSALIISFVVLILVVVLGHWIALSVEIFTWGGQDYWPTYVFVTVGSFNMTYVYLKLSGRWYRENRFFPIQFSLKRLFWAVILTSAILPLNFLPRKLGRTLIAGQVSLDWKFGFPFTFLEVFELENVKSFDMFWLIVDIFFYILFFLVILVIFQPNYDVVISKNSSDVSAWKN